MTVDQTSTKRDTIVMVAEFPAVPPGTLFAYWTEPELLRRWWPPEAEVDQMVGGQYHFSWPTMDWHLRGTYSAFEPARRLAFDWNWDHDDLPPRQVDLLFEPSPLGGTRLTLTHGAYGDSVREQEDRQGHIDGWSTFLPQLQTATAQHDDR